jgi:hypothetical protein
MISQVEAKYFKLAVSGPYRESGVDIAVKCPICGDSKTKRSKRLHLYHKDSKTRVKCFNGGCLIESPHTLGRFLKLYYPNLYQDYKRETFKVKIEKEPENTTITMKAFGGSEKTQAISKEENCENSDIDKNTQTSTKPENTQITSFEENCESKEENCESQETAKANNFKFLLKLSQNLSSLDEKTEAFLLKRGLNPKILMKEFGKFYTGTGDFNYNGRFYKIKNTLFIPILDRNQNISGFYARDIQEKRFINYNHSGRAFIPFNYNQVDLENEVYIFEAILDTFSFYQLYGLKNCIALCTNTINPYILSTIKKPVFCLDNDAVGIRTMLKYINVKDAKFLIYDSKCKDFNEMLLKNEKMELNFESGFKANLSLRKLIA